MQGQIAPPVQCRVTLAHRRAAAPADPNARAVGFDRQTGVDWHCARGDLALCHPGAALGTLDPRLTAVLGPMIRAA